MMENDLQRQQPLPPAAYGLAIRLGANPALSRSTIHIRQTGRMKDIGAVKWRPFRATQTMATRTCSFDWQARFGPLGMIGVRDAYIAGEGKLSVEALGFIPILRAQSSVQLRRGELMRYLAELAWAPDAILLNTELRWRQDGPDTLAVSAGSGDAEAEIVLNLDSEGRIAGAFAPDRARSIKPPYQLTPWRGRFSDYRRHQGLWIPFAGEVGWEIDGQLTTYFQCQIDSWETSSR